jgi:hypothetical protein
MSLIRRFDQRRAFERRQFELHHDKLRLFVKDADGTSEVDVPLENLTDVRRRRLTRSAWLLKVGVSFALFALVFGLLALGGVPAGMRYVPIWGFVAVVSLAWYYVGSRDHLLLETTAENSVHFLTNVPSREAVEGFIDEVLRARSAYLREKYARIFPENPPAFELARVRELLERKIITPEEFAKFEVQLTTARDSEPGTSTLN